MKIQIPRTLINAINVLSIESLFGIQPTPTYNRYMSCKYLTVIASVGAANVGRIAPSLASGGEGVRASSSSSTTGGETGEGLEIQPQLANIIIHFAKSKCTGPRSCRSVGASITRILDVGSIC